MSGSKDELIPFDKYKLPPIGHAISGAVGSILSNLIIYPIDISTTRLQLENKDKNDESKQNNGLIDMIQKIYKEGGLPGLYTGLGADTLATLLSSFIYFYCYTSLRNIQEKWNKSWGKPTQLNIYQELFLGAEAALISRFFTSPVSNITTRLQTSSTKQTFMEVAKDIYNEKGITGFWTGYRASMVLVSNPSITYFTFEKLKGFYLQTTGNKTLTSLQTFLFSAFAKSVATMITYPFIFIRANMVANKDTKGKSKMGDHVKKPGMIQLLQQVINNEGLSGIYKGMRAQITKGFFNSGILFMIKDYVAAYLTIVFYASYKLAARKNAIQ
ncbi:unnamed protein product [Cunninghamella blakesleeana]